MPSHAIAHWLLLAELRPSDCPLTQCDNWLASPFVGSLRAAGRPPQDSGQGRCNVRSLQEVRTNVEHMRPSSGWLRHRRLLDLPIGALTVTLILVGCERTSAPEGRVVVDSSGVSIVINHRPSDPGVPQIGPELVSVGGDTGFLFGSVTDAVILDDQRIAVLDGLARRVYLFEPDGELSDSLGREGDGPGEFRRPSRLGAAASSGVLVFDLLAQRVTHFPGGSSEREPSTWPVGGDITVTDLAFLSEELAVVIRGSFRERMEQQRLPLGYHQVPGEIAVVNWTSGERVSLSEESVTSFTLLSGNRVSGSPFAYRARVAATESQVVILAREGSSLRRYDLGGRLTQEVRYPQWGGPIRKAELDSLREHHRRLTLEDGSPFLEEVFAPDAQPELRPTFGRVLLSATGCIWAGSFTPNNGTPESWAVFGSDGRLRTMVALPPDAEPIWIGRDKLILRHIDPLGVQSIRVHEIRS